MSEVLPKSTAAEWAPAVLQRRRALVQRMAMAAATALIFTPVLGWSVSTTWLVVYFAIQLLDTLTFAPVTSTEVGRLGPLRTVVGGAMLFLNSASFGSLSILLWLTGGVMGGACASILLASGAIYSVMNSPRSPVVLALTLTPQFLYLAMTTVFMLKHGAAPSFATAAGIAIFVFAAYCVSTWRNIDKAYVAESEARRVAEQRRAEAEAVVASRAAFLAAIGHDLRTPIGAILTGSAEMDRTATDASSRAQAALITDAGLMMKALLDNLLDHSRLDAGRMTVEADDFNLRLMLAQTMKLWSGPVRAKGLSLRIEGAREVPAMVRGDAMRLRQILNNLVSNAVKFTDKGSITLRIRAWAEEPSGHAVLIEVADTGPGLTREQMARLFNAFDQTADGVSARHGGTGLGLSISRDLAHLMGGRLTARSQPGQGACFTLSLVMAPAVNPAVVSAPLDVETRVEISRALVGQTRPVTVRPVPVAPEPAQKPETAADPVPGPVTDTSSVEALLEALLGPVAIPEPGVEAVARAGKAAPAMPEVEPEIEPEPEQEAGAEEAEAQPLRVLVVDDHDINRRAVELILTPMGCDIVSAADGLLALKLCEINRFDVIFMDVRMPEMDGREATRRLRAGGGPNAGVPVIAVTADTGPEDVAACMAAGMTYFVSKPLTPPALLGALQHVLSGEADAADAETVAA